MTHPAALVAQRLRELVGVGAFKDKAADTIDALLAELAEAKRDAARWRMLAHIEASMALPDTLAFYICHPAKLDYAIFLKSRHDAQEKS
jgi:hypothetical protein